MIRDYAKLDKSANAYAGIRGRMDGDMLIAQSRPAIEKETMRWCGFVKDQEGVVVNVEKNGGVWLRLTRHAYCIFDKKADLLIFEYSLDG